MLGISFVMQWFRFVIIINVFIISVVIIIDLVLLLLLT